MPQEPTLPAHPLGNQQEGFITDPERGGGGDRAVKPLTPAVARQKVIKAPME